MFAQSFNKSLRGQRANRFAITYAATVRTAECKPHLDIVFRRAAVRRPVQMKICISVGFAIAEVVPNLTNIIFMLDACVVVNAGSGFRVNVCSLISHNRNKYT